MRTWQVIFWRDFKTDLCSLKTGTVAFFYLLFAGAFFFTYVDAYISAKAQLGSGVPAVEQLWANLFGPLRFVLILVTPAITMGTFADEKRLHTLRLLQASPVSAATVVAGKFAAALALMSCVLLASLAYPIFLWAHGSMDPGVVLTSYAGLFLLVCAQIAFGLWVSALAAHPFHAFLFTMFGLFLALIINTLASSLQGYALTHRVLGYLGSSGHLDSFLQGQIVVADLSYFVLATILFLYLSSLTYDALMRR